MDRNLGECAERTRLYKAWQAQLLRLSNCVSLLPTSSTGRLLRRRKKFRSVLLQMESIYKAASDAYVLLIAHLNAHGCSDPAHLFKRRGSRSNPSARMERAKHRAGLLAISDRAIGEGSEEPSPEAGPFGWFRGFRH